MTSTPATLDRQKNELASILNVDGIKTGNPKWLALMREGVSSSSTSAAGGPSPAWT